MTLTAEFIQGVKSWAWIDDTRGQTTGVLFLSHPTDPVHDPYRAARVRRDMDELADALWLTTPTENVRDIGARVALESPTSGALHLAEGMPPVLLSIGPEWARRTAAERLPILVFLSTLDVPVQTVADADATLKAPRAMDRMRIGCTSLRHPGGPASAAARTASGVAS